MSEELKPCPFCGGEAELYGISSFWNVKCLKGCCFRPATEGNSYTSKEIAIDNWNTRRPSSISAVDCLKDAITTAEMGNRASGDQIDKWRAACEKITLKG